MLDRDRVGWTSCPWGLRRASESSRQFNSSTSTSRRFPSTFRASKLLGTKVENEKNEKIGTLDDLVITTDHKLFAVLQVGGFLGLGGYLVALPYESLAINDHGRKITLAGASKDAVHKLPEFQYPKSS